jgi:hypothetical protein
LSPKTQAKYQAFKDISLRDCQFLCPPVTSKVQIFLTSNQLFKRKGISFFCVLLEEGHGEVLTGFFFVCSTLFSLFCNGFFFPFMPKTFFLKEEGQVWSFQLFGVRVVLSNVLSNLTLKFSNKQLEKWGL